ncbi:MAG: cupin domain-containing protein [Anaerolineae bacterium]|jgi:quercetin dioxygenase-like cupin family protein|nr:cupin domain-containing protein [Anaerolineae bacterium]MBT3713667.1 cupin domain-containing protein [Anaerolineae bacterium]MBT4309173.1 cupin domain-containing protein [Anaerolineae bacterium]MBT4459640.1 cupin domain-containing protein [Anaerolineae bacterium]MBT4841603.1 cupin domain-containing protein [Anaerolineae bacterium]
MQNKKNILLKVIRWREHESPKEKALAQILRDEGLSYYPWSNSPNDLYAPHLHTYDKIVYVVRGSITFILPDEEQSLTLHAGDRLELPANTIHSAAVSSQGVTCFEAHL